VVKTATIVGFNYASLEPSQRTAAEGAARRIHQLHSRMGADAVAIGKSLIAVRETLPPGTFLAWCRAEFGWAPSTVARFQQVAERFGQLDCLDRFQPYALYQLVRNKVTDQARQECIDMARAGQLVTLSHANDVIQRHCPEEPGLPIRRDRVVRAKNCLEQLARDWPAEDRRGLATLLTAMLREVLEVHAPEALEPDAESVGLLA
jgi:hypothetical protein